MRDKDGEVWRRSKLVCLSRHASPSVRALVLPRADTLFVIFRVVRGRFFRSDMKGTDLREPVFWIRAASLLSLLGFVWLFATLGADGQHTRKGPLFYLPYAEAAPEMGDELARGRVPLDMNSVEISSGVYRHFTKIQTGAAGQLAKAKRIDIELTTPSQDCEVLDAHLIFVDPSNGRQTISFHVPKKQLMPLGGFLSLQKNPGTSDTFSEDQIAELQITTRGSPKLSVWVQTSKERPISSILWVRLANASNEQNFASFSGLIAYGREGVSNFSRAQLLAYTWGYGVEGSKIIYGICGCACLAWLVAVVLLSWPHLFAVGAFRAAVEALAAGLLCVSSCVVYAVVTPPFHGPDEPSHFLAFTVAGNNQPLAEDALELANHGHFERIKRRPDEKFTAADVGASRQDAWAYYIFATPINRSPLAVAIWRILSQGMPPAHAGKAMLLLRLSNAVFVGIALAVALYAAGRLVPETGVFPWFAAPALLVPSIAFYMAMVSNYPYLIGGYLLQAVALGLLLSTLGTADDTGRARVTAGSLIGVGLGVSICCSENSLAVLPFWGVVIPAYFFSYRLSNNAQNHGKAALNEFMIPLSGAALSICLLVAALSSLGLFLPGRLLDVLERTPLRLVGPFWSGLLLLLACGAGLWLGSLAALTFGRRLQHAAWPGCIRFLFVSVILIVSVILLATDPATVPHIIGPWGPRPPLADYIGKVVYAFVDGLAPGVVDMLTPTFWILLGWLDCELPQYIMHTLRIMTGVGVVILLLESCQSKRFPVQAIFAASCVIAVLFCVAAIAGLYNAAGINVNSRYIMIGYIFSLLMAFEGYRRVFQRLLINPVWRAAINSGFCLLVMGLHSAAWVAAIGRYLGAS